MDREDWCISLKKQKERKEMDVIAHNPWCKIPRVPFSTLPAGSRRFGEPIDRDYPYFIPGIWIDRVAIQCVVELFGPDLFLSRKKMLQFLFSKSRRWRFSDDWCRKFDEPHINESMQVTHNILRILFAYPNISNFLFFFSFFFLHHVSKWPMQNLFPPVNFTRSERGMLEL